METDGAMWQVIHGVQRHFLGYTSCELCIILEYMYDVSDYFGKENMFEFGHI